MEVGLTGDYRKVGTHMALRRVLSETFRNIIPKSPVKSVIDVKCEFG